MIDEGIKPNKTFGTGQLHGRNRIERRFFHVYGCAYRILLNGQKAYGSLEDVAHLLLDCYWKGERKDLSFLNIDGEISKLHDGEGIEKNERKTVAMFDRDYEGITKEAKECKQSRTNYFKGVLIWLAEKEGFLVNKANGTNEMKKEGELKEKETLSNTQHQEESIEDLEQEKAKELKKREIKQVSLVFFENGQMAPISRIPCKTEK
jgi:hypothetical protein